MRYKGVFQITLGVLFVLWGGLAVYSADNAVTGASQFTSMSMGWLLSHGTVIRAGQGSLVEGGILFQDYVVECQATATTHETPIQRGTFRVTLSAFSPSRDLPGQKAGYWYVRGVWTLTDIRATEKEKRARHSPTVLKGDLGAELSFNPASAHGTLEALVLLPNSPSGSALWSRGRGVYSGNERFEGVINVAAQVVPDTKGVKK